MYRALLANVMDRSKVLAIPEGQNFRQNLQALAVLKIQISIYQNKALIELRRTLTVGRCELRWYGSFSRF